MVGVSGSIAERAEVSAVGISGDIDVRAEVSAEGVSALGVSAFGDVQVREFHL